MGQPNQMKRQIRSIERIVTEEGPSWPPDLLALGKEAVIAAKALDQPRIEKLTTLLRDCGAIITKFADAHAAHLRAAA